MTGWWTRSSAFVAKGLRINADMGWMDFGGTDFMLMALAPRAHVIGALPWD
jgi:hypothetical protein